MDIITNSGFGRFGIKEVADVAFYQVGDLKITSTGELESNVAPVLVFDTLKISNFEITGETAEARGGKGNTVLMSWDHSREATLTLEDALMSMDTLNVLLSSGTLEGTKGTKEVLTIDANGFPGEYTVVGKTYARSATDGTDKLLTFVIWKAKVQSEASFEMSADGDPSTLNMTLKVLRAETNTDIGSRAGEMVKFIMDNTDTNNPTIVLPGIDTDATYTRIIKFKYANGKVERYELQDGSTLTAPDNTDTDLEWVPAVVTTVAGDATYEEQEKTTS